MTLGLKLAGIECVCVCVWVCKYCICSIQQLSASGSADGIKETPWLSMSSVCVCVRRSCQSSCQVSSWLMRRWKCFTVWTHTQSLWYCKRVRLTCSGVRGYIPIWLFFFSFWWRVVNRSISFLSGKAEERRTDRQKESATNILWFLQLEFTLNTALHKLLISPFPQFVSSTFCSIHFLMNTTKLT